MIKYYFYIKKSLKNAFHNINYYYKKYLCSKINKIKQYILILLYFITWIKNYLKWITINIFKNYEAIIFNEANNILTRVNKNVFLIIIFFIVDLIMF